MTITSPSFWRGGVLAGALAAGLAASGGCGARRPGPPEPAPPRGPAFEEVTAAAGIDYVHDNGRFGKKLFPEIMGSGAAFLDADQDGFLDLYLVNCQTLPGAPARRRPQSRFYRNRGDGTFEDRTAGSGLGRVGFGMGTAVGDIDNDGDPDLYVTSFGPDFLFLNRGDGTFLDVTRRAGLGSAGFGTSAAFLDYDRDGDLDLYRCNYVVLPEQIEKIVCRNPKGGLQYCDIHLYAGAPDRLYRNNGDGTFTDVSRAAGLSRERYRGLAILCSDYDSDGWIDIFVANDEHPMLLWRNQGDGTFVDVAGEAGVAYDGAGRAVAGMGLDMAELKRDGRFYLYESNFQGRYNVLFSPEAPGFYADRTESFGLGSTTLDRLGFGVGFLDYDLDCWPDLVVANGHVIDDIQEFQPAISYPQAAQLFRNAGAGRFADASGQLGLYARVKRVGRGALLADYDNDGDVDVLFTNNNAAPALLRNLARERAVANHWVAVRCVGTRSARDAYGALVTVEAGGVRQMAEVRAAAGYLGSNDPRVHFGLGSAQKINRLTVRWPAGNLEEAGETVADRELVVREGVGLVSQ